MKRLIALLLVAAASSAHALDCANAVTTADMRQCAALEQQRAEEQLNQQYRRIIARLGNAGSKQALIEAQRLWIKFRAADCKAAAARYQGGSLAPVIQAGCMSTHATARIQQLEQFYQLEQP